MRKRWNGTMASITAYTDLLEKVIKRRYRKHKKTNKQTKKIEVSPNIARGLFIAFNWNRKYTWNKNMGNSVHISILIFTWCYRLPSGITKSCRIYLLYSMESEVNAMQTVHYIMVLNKFAKLVDNISMTFNKRFQNKTKKNTNKTFLRPKPMVLIRQRFKTF